MNYSQVIFTCFISFLSSFFDNAPQDTPLLEHVVQIWSQKDLFLCYGNLFYWQNLKNWNLKGLCRKKIKKSIFEHSCPQILTKVGTLLHFSKCYAVVELKLKSDILNWTKLSKTANFTATSVFKLHPQKFTNAKIL